VPLGQRVLQRGPGQPSPPVDGDLQQVDVHDARRVGDGRVRFCAASHDPSRGPLTLAQRLGHVPSRDERGQVAESAALDEHATGFRWEAREVSDPTQRLVLRVHRASALEPRPGVDRRRTDDQVKQRRGLGRRARDERQVARVVDRQARLGQH